MFVSQSHEVESQCTANLPHLPNFKEQTLVSLLGLPYWTHSHSDGCNWNAFEVVVSGDNKEGHTCPYCLDIRKSKGISRHAQYCTKNEKKK